MGQNTSASQGSFYEGLAEAIDRMATMLFQNTEATADPDSMDEALRALQTQIEKLQQAKKPGSVQADFVTFSAADAAKQNLRYQQLFESVTIPYITTNLDGEISKANQVAFDFLKFGSEDPKKTSLVTCVAQGDRRSFRKALQQLKNGRAIFIPSLHFNNPSGEAPAEYGVHAVPVVIAETGLKEIDWLLTPATAPVKKRAGVGTDVLTIETLKDKLLQADEEFTRAELDTFRGYAATHKTLSAAVDVSGLLDIMASELANLIGDYCFLGLLSSERKDLVPTAAATNQQDDEIIQQFLQVETATLPDDLVRKVIKGQAPDIITDQPVTGAPLDGIFPKQNVNMLMVPLRAGKTTLGLLSLVRDGNAKPYQDYEVIIVQNLADHVGLILRYLDSAASYLNDPAVEPLHAAFLEEVCTELQASMHPLYGYVEMLKEQAQELKLSELENDIGLILKAAAYSNQVLGDTFNIVQLDAGVRKPSVESYTVSYFVAELTGVIRHLSGIDDIIFEQGTFPDDAHVHTDILWAGQIIQKVLGCLICDTGKIRVVEKLESGHISIQVECEEGMFKHQLAVHSCTIGTNDNQKDCRPFYKRGVAMNLAQRLSDKLGAKISYSSDKVEFKTVNFTFPLSESDAKSSS